ncbi:MAG: lysophospholipase [Acidobacteria bacterium]|nr:MAG: lysophospholipase [Acidobacteriota bacterium]
MDRFRLGVSVLALILSAGRIAAQEPTTGAARPSPPSTGDTRRPTLFLIGDSTVRNGRGDGAGGQWGWGEPLAALFDAAKIAVVNRALGGRSSRTYLTGGQWEAVKAELRPGDFVLVQFGHNDGGAINDTSRARGSLPGTGAETAEIDNLLTHEREIVYTYGSYLRRFIGDTKAAGATPIVLSPVPRKTWKDGRIVRSEDYGRWAAEVALSEHVPFVDLNQIVARRYEALGPEKVEALFADEHTHTTRAGAEINAAAVVEGLEALEGRPLSSYLASR